MFVYGPVVVLGVPTLADLRCSTRIVYIVYTLAAMSVGFCAELWDLQSGISGK